MTQGISFTKEMAPVIEYGHISDLFPGHRHVFQQLQHCMGHVLEGTVKQNTKYILNSGNCEEIFLKQ